MCKFKVGSYAYDETKMTFNASLLSYDDSLRNTILDYNIKYMSVSFFSFNVDNYIELNDRFQESTTKDWNCGKRSSSSTRSFSTRTNSTTTAALCCHPKSWVIKKLNTKIALQLESYMRRRQMRFSSFRTYFAWVEFSRLFPLKFVTSLQSRNYASPILHGAF